MEPMTPTRVVYCSHGQGSVSRQMKPMQWLMPVKGPVLKRLWHSRGEKSQPSRQEGYAGFGLCQYLHVVVRTGWPSAAVTAESTNSRGIPHVDNERVGVGAAICIVATGPLKKIHRAVPCVGHVYGHGPGKANDIPAACRRDWPLVRCPPTALQQPHQPMRPHSRGSQLLSKSCRCLMAGLCEPNKTSPLGYYAKVAVIVLSLFGCGCPAQCICFLLAAPVGSNLIC